MHLREIARGISSGAYKKVYNAKSGTGAAYSMHRLDRDAVRIFISTTSEARPIVISALINPQEINMHENDYGYVHVGKDSEITLPYEGWEIVK